MAAYGVAEVTDMADGKIRTTTLADIVVGAVLREVTGEGTTPQFGDSVVVRVEDGEDDFVVLLARPMASLRGGSLETRVEEFSVPRQRLVGERSIFGTVCLDSGRPASVAY